jgi:hypothetical protein
MNYKIIFLLLFALSTAWAEQEASNNINEKLWYEYFGLFASPAYNSNTLDARLLNSFYVIDSLNSPRIANGNNIGAVFGIYCELPLSKKLFLQLRVGCLLNKLNISQNFDTIGIFIGKQYPATIEHDFNANMTLISFEPRIKWAFYKKFSFILGMGYAIRLPNDYEHRERIITPDSISYPNGTAQQLVINDLNKKVNSGLFFNFGLNYEFPHIKLLPGNFGAEIIFDYGYIDIADNLTVNINSIQLGLTYKF